MKRTNKVKEKHNIKKILLSMLSIGDKITFINNETSYYKENIIKVTPKYIISECHWNGFDIETKLPISQIKYKNNSLYYTHSCKFYWRLDKQVSWKK